MRLDEYTQDLQSLTNRERFLYLIQLGNTLPAYPDECRQDDYEVPGCTSLVYIRARLVEGVVQYEAYAAAKVVRGYLRILLDALNGKTPEEIIQDELVERFIEQADMNVSTQTSRANAFANMYAFMKNQAATLSSS